MLTRPEIKEKITKWIVDENWSYNIIDDPNFYFLCNIVDDQNIVYVGIEKRIDRITIHYPVTLTQNLHNSYKLAIDKEDFWFDLKVELMLMDVNANAIPNFEELQTIDVFIMIYFDAFLQDKFIHSVIKIIDAMGLCLYMWKKFVESQQPV
ncbi:MAG: DUF2299 family protein [Nitrosopumilus sp.]|nr:DUF2299 family protein [Nitrosopumilus sp.]